MGLTGFSTRAHIVRAMLEAVCFQTREVLDAMRKDADMAGLRSLRVDGGATQNNLLMQLQADILQVPPAAHRAQTAKFKGQEFEWSGAEPAAIVDSYCCGWVS